MKTYHHTFQFSFLSLCFLTLNVHADLRMEELFNMPLEEILQIKITGATLTDESLQSVPSTVTVIKREEIRRLGITRLDDLMRFIPGYQSYRGTTGSLDSLYSIRGRSESGGSRDVLVLIDGMRLNGDAAGGASINEPAITLENVARVEFIRGPGSAVYGSNAFSGVINIITTSHREIALAAGSYHQRDGTVQWQWGSDKRQLAVMLRHASSDGEPLDLYDVETQTTVATRDPSSMDDFSLNAQWDGWKLQTRFSGRDSERFYAGTGISDTWNSTDQRNVQTDLSYLWHWNAHWSLDTHLMFSERHLQLRSGPSAIESPINIAHGLTTVDEREPGAATLLRYEDEQQLWLAGYEFRQPEITDSTTYHNVNLPFAPFNIDDYRKLLPEEKRTVRGIYTQYQRELSKQWTITVGLRHDDYSNVGSHLSPRLAAVYKVDARNSLKMFYGEAFRAPTPAELNLQNTGGVIGNNPDLKPETIKTTELVWMRLLNEGYLQVSLFDSQLMDAITFTTTAPITPFNGGEQTFAGIELEWSQRLAEHWQVRTAITWIVDEVHSDINTESNVLFGGSLSYIQPAWSFSLMSNFSNARQQEVQVTSTSLLTEKEFGGHTTFDAMWRYIAIRNWEIYLRADNLTDKQYHVPSGNSTIVEGIPESGRSLTAGLRWEFN